MSQQLNAYKMSSNLFLQNIYLKANLDAMKITK